MSDSEISSNDSPQRSDISSDGNASDSQDYLVVGASYAPYQGEPLAKKNTHSVSDELIDACMSDIDYLIQIEKRLSNGSNCANCH